MKLSVVIIAYNEEHNIGRCIQSVQGLADEVLVVDSFSADRTVAICQELGARVVQHAFTGHIEQKNYALSKATFDWVLSLDADEALSNTLKQSIQNIKSTLENGVGGYTMNRLTNYCGHWVRHCGWYPDTKLRLFNRTLGEWGGVNPHDKFELYDKKALPYLLKGDILHYSYYTRSDHYRQVEYFTTIAAKAHYARGKRARVINLLVNPAVKFLRDFVLKLGFLDGSTGFTISRISAYATYLKYKKILALQRHATV